MRQRRNESNADYRQRRSDAEMGRKKSKKPRKKPVAKPRIKWRAAAVELASCALFTLTYFKHLTKYGTTFPMKDGKPALGESRRWQEKYLDALDRVGYVIDRDKYYAGLEPKKRSKGARK